MGTSVSPHQLDIIAVYHDQTLLARQEEDYQLGLLLSS
jgi:hypothetical protein